MEKHSKQQLFELKKEARHLITNEGMSQKKAASLLGISEKSMTAWVKKYGWKTKNDTRLYGIVNANSLIDYLNFVRDLFPQHHEQSVKMYKAFVKTI